MIRSRFSFPVSVFFCWLSFFVVFLAFYVCNTLDDESPSLSCALPFWFQQVADFSLQSKGHTLPKVFAEGLRVLSDEDSKFATLIASLEGSAFLSFFFCVLL